MRSGTASPLPEANSRARKQSQMVRTIASSSNGAWRYVTCSSSLLFDGEDGSLPAQPHDNAFDEQSELTYASPPGYRESGSPEVLPLHTPNSASTTSVAISSQSQPNNYYRTRQDVHFPVNSSASSLSSTVPRPTAQSAQPLESPLSSYHSQHVSINSPTTVPGRLPFLYLLRIWQITMASPRFSHLHHVLHLVDHRNLNHSQLNTPTSPPSLLII